MTCDPSIYSGCAEHYVRGRPPYSRALAPMLAAHLGPSAGGRLLDVGAGPGSLAHALRSLFSEIVAVEPDAGMVAVGEAWALRAGLDTLRYVRAQAEMLGELDLGRFDLVTFGQSFHWTVREKAAVLACERLVPGGHIALVAHRHEGRTRPTGPGAPLIPHEAVHALIRSYLGERPRAGPNADDDVVLAGAGFSEIERLYAPGRADLLCDVEAVTSNFLSMSFAAPPLFGDRLDAFRADLRAVLLAHSPAGIFWDWPGDTEVLLARKPGNSTSPARP